jgi:hypothetical protein
MRKPHCEKPNEPHPSRRRTMNQPDAQESPVRNFARPPDRRVGPVKPINPAHAREAHDYRFKPAATSHYYARRVLKQGREALD